jgi:hypothetical protein
MEASFVTRVLVWLDYTTEENRDLQDQLRTIVDDLKIFTNHQECELYIRKIHLFSPNNQQVILIVSGQLGQSFVPLIHDLPQVKRVYVFCIKKETNCEWTNKFIKV